MKPIRSTFWVVVFFSLVWLALLVPRNPAPFVAALRGEELVAAELRVEDSGCSRSGEEVLWSCEATGLVEAPGAAVSGSTATLRWQSEDGHYVQSGTLVPVLAGHWLPLPVGPAVAIAAVDEPREWGWRELQPALRLPKLGLAVMLGALLLSAVSHLQRARGDDRMELDLHGSSLGCATFLLGVGVPLFALEASAATGWAIGLVVLALLVQLRRVVVIDRRAATLARGWQLFLFRRLGPATPLGELSGVAVTRKAQAAEVFLVGSAGRQQVVAQATPAAAERQAQRLARFLGVPLGDGTRPAEKRVARAALPARVAPAAPAGDGRLAERLAAARRRHEERAAAPRSVPGVSPTAPPIGGSEPRPALAIAGCLILAALASGLVSFALGGGWRGLARRALSPAVAAWPAGEWVQGGAVALLGEGRGSDEELTALLGRIERSEPESEAWRRSIRAACAVAGRDELRDAPPEEALAELRAIQARQRSTAEGEDP